ncbi:MAG TPA: hypothetical protein VJ698_16525 [Noviherbaspirillum sp.]|uniref:hypothetical protein n=1 Tax=Noviherbaspirillum sp. TaxID=1926288 RepID=UPI002B481F76|nr:hypothetical protein [Noviherbaspirillum sp.]HJV87071.1 hypothetical protein [Noviherbaspirillum sp.]
MYIVAIAWIYVVLMMSLTEQSLIAGLMTFLLYGLLPLATILYVMGSPRRKHDRAKARKSLRESGRSNETPAHEEKETNPGASD